MTDTAAKNDLSKFLGVWRLIKCTETNSNGDVFYTWGADAIGYIIYTSEGIMAVQIMRQDRKLFSVKDITQATEEEAQALVKDYNAYFGHFEVDATHQRVIHHIEGHLLPNLIGQDNIRAYRFYENKLSLTTIGGNVARELLWEKIN